MIINMNNLINSLVALCHPLLEVAVFDANSKKELSYENVLSSNKADTVLRESDLGKAKPFIEHLSNGVVVKSTITTIRESGKKYYVRSRLDITLFQTMQQQLNPLLAEYPTKNNADRMQIPESWQGLIDAEINTFYTAKKTTQTNATRNQKRDLVHRLYQQGLFNYKEASSYVANCLSTSRATIYNYINWAKTVSSVQVHQVNAFTDKKFGGNPAGVVLDAELLSDDMMRNIAREMNLSETSFVLPDKKADFRLRYFTASGVEVDFCGHSTVGALHMLAEQQRHNTKKTGQTHFNVATNVGNLAMEVDINKKGEISVSYETPKIEVKKNQFTHDEIAGALGISTEEVVQSVPVMYEKTNKDIFITIRSLSKLNTLEVDYRRLKQFCKTQGIVAFCLLTNETVDSKNHIHMRCFAPAVGINEDPFTGSVLGGLVAYVHSNGLIDRRLSSIHVEQGHYMKRSGSVVVKFNIINKKYYAQVFAKAVPFFSTEIQLINSQKEELS